MAPKQRQVRIEQRGAQAAIEALEQRSDEELEAETKYKSAALAILGARASERFDAEQARAYFQRAIAAATASGTDADSAHGRRFARACGASCR